MSASPKQAAVTTAADDRARSERDFARWLDEVDLEKLDLQRLANDPAVGNDSDDDERVD